MVDKDIKKKKSSKKFDTTTTLNINDVYGEEEITLKEELSDINEYQTEEIEDESVTAKIPQKKDQKEISGVSKKLKQINQQIYEDDKHVNFLNSLKNFLEKNGLVFVSFFSSLWSNINKVVREKSFKKIVWTRTKLIIVANIIILAILVILIFIFMGQKPKPKKFTPKNLPGHEKALSLSATHDLELSTINYIDLNGKKLLPQRILAGSTFYLDFYVMKWNKTEKLNLKVAIRVYTEAGKLELYNPNFIFFSEPADMTKDKIRVRTKMNLSKNIPLGNYRVVISLTEISTLRRATLQTRMNIIK